MRRFRIATWAVTTGLLANADSAAFGQNPGGTPPAQPVGPVTTVNWKRTGTTDPVPPPPLAPPIVVVARSEEPVTPAGPMGFQLVQQTQVRSGAVRPGTFALPQLPHRYQDPTNPVGPGQLPSDPPVRPVIRTSGAAPGNEAGPVSSGVGAWRPAQLPGPGTRGAPAMIAQPQPNPPAVVPDSVAPAPASPGAAVPAPADSAPCPPAPAAPTGPRWQTPMPRPGYFAVPPTGPGYYTLLDQIHNNERETPPKYPYPRVSPIFLPNYDVNWSYLKDPKNTEHDYADVLKWIPLGEHATFTTGGEFRYRFMNEVNSNGRTSGATDAYNLFRTRIYGDLWIEDWLRFYGEFLYADVTDRSIPPLVTDINRGDILNLFADLRVFKFGEKDNPVYVRVGRQEMLYGSQRLISPLDWVNTRRTFEGVKVFTRTEKWDFDVFGVQPVVPPRASQFDTADHNQFFSGAWFTYRPVANQNVDLYYLDLNNTNAGAAVGQGGVPGNYNVSTFGSRYAGTANNWMWDFEAMLQFGHYSNQSIIARAFAVDGGYNFKDVMWNPQLWVGYEYASGDPDPQNTPTRRTFNQLFPFGHYYFGYADLVGRQNINDYFVQGILYPAKWLFINAQFHVFRLDSNKDALYGAGGSIIRQDRTGKAGNDVGNEFDVLSNFHLTNHSDVLVGYSYLWAGSYLKNTAPAGAAHNAMSANPSLFYAQYSYRW